ncbi:MAG: bifunctional phosphoglucose/phosphomannose isomerase [Ignavibacteria bacterium]
MITNVLSKIDKGNMFNVLKEFGNQVYDAYELAERVALKNIDLDRIKNIVITGLGGSAIGGDLVRNAGLGELKVPLTVNRHYTLPAFVGKDTLVIVSSYSGNTEETISSYKQAIKLKAQIICITSGGEVQRMAEKYKHNLFLIPQGYQPRCALGYNFVSMWIALAKLKFVSKKTAEFKNVVKILRRNSTKYTVPDIVTNDALRIAAVLKGKLPIIYSSVDNLEAVNLRWRGQLSENAKILAYGNLYPEMNHNELVGWKLNKNILKNIVVIFLEDSADHKRVKTRIAITKKIYQQYSDNIISLSSRENTRFERIFDLIYLGDWVSYYLAILNNVDPTPVEIINHLKSELAKIK